MESLSIIYEEFSNLKIKKNNWIENRQKTLQRWQISIWEERCSSLPIREMKIKATWDTIAYLLK